jgi:hypothetical protein
MTTNGTSMLGGSTLPPPLRTAPDMRPHWDDVELSFDQAAQRIIAAHAADGHAADLPVTDLKTWAIAPLDGQFALVPLARHHEPKPLRNNAFSNLMTRLGAPAEFLRDRLPAALQIATANWLLGTSDGSSAATLRLRGGEVAAVVSGRYAPLDPVELVDTLHTALPLAAVSPIQPRACPRPLALVHPNREVLGLEGAHLLDVGTAPVEPLGYLFGLPPPRVRGPFGMRTVIVRRGSRIWGRYLFGDPPRGMGSRLDTTLHVRAPKSRPPARTGLFRRRIERAESRSTVSRQLFVTRRRHKAPMALAGIVTKNA